MTLLPSCTGKELIAALRSAGFEVLRIKGSHHFLRHADGRTTSFPYIPGKRSDQDCSRRSCATAISAESNSAFFRVETGRGTGVPTAGDRTRFGLFPAHDGPAEGRISAYRARNRPSHGH